MDTHYASALFRYEKEFAVKFHEITNLVFLDDKYRCKVGELGFPVAAVDRGKKVVVSKDTTFVVADHDFTKTGIIPSVAMICNIPESINGDFYAGKVHIRLKDPIFQPSSPLRQARPRRMNAGASNSSSFSCYLKELNAKSYAPELNALLTPFMLFDSRPTLLSHSHGMKYCWLVTSLSRSAQACAA